MVDYTLRSSCQANGRGFCGEFHVGFYLARRKLGVTKRLPGVRTQRHLLALYHCAGDTESPYDRSSGWYEQAEDRKDDEALEHVKNHGGAGALSG